MAARKKAASDNKKPANDEQNPENDNKKPANDHKKTIRKPKKPKEASWRIKTLAHCKYCSTKVIEPYEFKNVIHPSTLNGRRPERVLAAAYPYDRILLDTKEKFADVLTPRSKRYIELVLSNTVNTIYSKLVKRPQCMGPIREVPKPIEWTPILWRKHKERILKLSTPRKAKERPAEKRKYMSLEKLMPRIESMSVPPIWRVHKSLSQDPNYRDPVKLKNRKCLSYEPTSRMLTLARPKKCDDQSVTGMMYTLIWGKFIKKTDHIYQRLIIREKLGFVK